MILKSFKTLFFQENTKVHFWGKKFDDSFLRRIRNSIPTASAWLERKTVGKDCKNRQNKR